MSQPLSRDDFAAITNVSRETLDRLDIYASLLIKWQGSMSLVGPSTMADIWRRHMLDSAQLIDRAPATANSWIDVGSGAGFPGLVLAILGARNVHLVESNTRKCEFLREVARRTDTDVTIHHERMEKIEPWPVDVITARAVAPLTKLLELSAPFMTVDSRCIFPKGQDVANELTVAAKYWNITVECMTSVSDQRGKIVHLTEVSHV